MRLASNSGWGAHRKLMVHADSARPHTAKGTLEFLEQNVMKRGPHPPYSRDLAPSDFDLVR
jgi:hypothetical protein